MFESPNDIPEYDSYVKSTRAHEIAFVDQRGPTCGIYALSAILQKYGTQIYATKGDPANTQATFSLRQLAKQMGVTQIGELFDANHVAMEI